MLTGNLGANEIATLLLLSTLTLAMNARKMLSLVFILLLIYPNSMRAQTSADPSSDLEQQLAALEKLVLQDEQPQPAPSPASPSTNPAPANTASTMPSAPLLESQALRYYRMLRQDTLRKDYGNAITAANNLAGADMSDAVQKAVSDILPELQKLKDAQDSQAQNQLKDLLDRTTKVITSAQDAKELDPVITEINDAINQSRSVPYNPSRLNVTNQLESASRFVKEWQSYLVDKSAGNTMQASNDLRELAGISDNYMPIPRSEILALALKVSGAQQQAIDSSIELHGFDDLPHAISQLQIMQRSGNYSMDMNNLMMSLQGLQNAYEAYQDKNYSGALQSLQNYMGGMVMFGGAVGSQGGGSQGSLHQEITALRNTLLIEIAQGLLALPDAPAPNQDERAPDYLLRVAALKEKAADWAGLQQVLVVYQQFTGPFPFNPQSWLQEDMAGLRAYLVGEKLEAAGQNLDAIRSYRQALATLGRFFPADPAAAKLRELEAKYPDLYKQALDQPISPKTP